MWDQVLQNGQCIGYYYTDATVGGFCIQLDILCEHNAGIMNDSGTANYIVAGIVQSVY
jgi:hypothetical protein